MKTNFKLLYNDIHDPIPKLKPFWEKKTTTPDWYYVDSEGIEYVDLSKRNETIVLDISQNFFNTFERDFIN